MPEASTYSKQRIAKNSIVLFIRMFITMIIGLYTSRVVLNTLGVSDYGIYNVVGAVVGIFGFISNSMRNASSRFIAVELGKGNKKSLSDTFNTALVLHFIVAVFIILLLETVGLFLFNNKLDIPDNRIEAAKIVYHLSVFTLLFVITQVPYSAALVAHERLDIFAYFEIASVVSKLLILFLLVYFDYDKLILFAILTFVVHICIIFTYRLYCIKHFEETRFQPKINKQILKSMLKFSTFDMFGNVCLTIKFQGMPILFNVFFGVIVNAAVGIVTTVSNVIRSFANNITSAFTPQITKLYAQKDEKSMLSILYMATRILCLFCAILYIPLFYNCEYILKLWLVNVPPLTTIFLQICLIETFFDVIFGLMQISLNATGNIKKFSFWQGLSKLLVIPISYLALLYIEIPEVIYIVSLLSALACLLIASYFYKLYVPSFSLHHFYKIILFVSFPIIFLIGLFYFVEKWNLTEFSKLIISTIIVVLIYTVVGYKLLTNSERNYVLKILKLDKWLFKIIKSF